MDIRAIGIGGIIAILVILVGFLMALGVVPMTPIIVGGSLAALGVARLT